MSSNKHYSDRVTTMHRNKIMDIEVENVHRDLRRNEATS